MFKYTKNWGRIQKLTWEWEYSRFLVTIILDITYILPVKVGFTSILTPDYSLSLLVLVPLPITRSAGGWCDGYDGPGGRATTTPIVPHERLVVPNQGVGQLPAVSAEVLKTGKVPETDILVNTRIWG